MDSSSSMLLLLSIQTVSMQPYMTPWARAATSQFLAPAGILLSLPPIVVYNFALPRCKSPYTFVIIIHVPHILTQVQQQQSTFYAISHIMCALAEGFYTAITVVVVSEPSLVPVQMVLKKAKLTLVPVSRGPGTFQRIYPHLNRPLMSEFFFSPCKAGQEYLSGYHLVILSNYNYKSSLAPTSL